MQIGVVLPASEIAGEGGRRTPPWTSVRSFALAAEDLGLDSVWMIDHFFNRSADGDLEGMYEAWTIVSALAAVTTRVQIGTLVLCGPFRNPGLVAKMAATADEVSAGRIILGLGAGWHDPELTAFGYGADHRGARFAEALPIVTGLLRGDTVTVAGRYHTMSGAVLTPAPTRRIPVLVAADGPRMLGLTARYADGWNTAWYGVPDDRLRTNLATMDRVLHAVGRDPATLVRTVAIYVHDPESGTPADPDDPAVTGSLDAVARAIDAYEALGIDHVMVQLLPHNRRSLDRLGAAVALRNGSA